jgi:hypothetical protein
VPALRALVVGIDRYPELQSGVSAYPSLYGAVADALRVEEYLREVLEVPESRITRLLAPHVGDDASRVPTLAKLTSALIGLEKDGRPGDQLLVYYSGHGGRAPTSIPEVKGEAGIDEVLVPVDVGDPAVPFLRDIEIAAWLARCAARGLFTTLILDCCHSGGAVRVGRRVRGSDRLDRAGRPAKSGLAERDEILALWRSRPADRAVDRLEALPVLRAPAGFALLAACRPQERALEVATPGGWQGVLTSCLLETLSRGVREGLTYRRLHRAVTARLHASGYVAQTPVLDGEAERRVFGRERLSDRGSVEVVEVEGWPGERVRISSGRLQGTRGGERFGVREGGVVSRNFADPVAEVEVIEASSTSSWARPVRRGARPIRPGDGVVFLAPGPLALRRTVSDRSSRAAPFDALLELEGEGLLAAAKEGAVADFEVDRVGGFLEVCDAGGLPLTHLGSPIPQYAPGADRELVRRLVHLARYWNLRAIENPERGSPLASTLRLRVERVVGANQISPCLDSSGTGDPDALPSGALLSVSLENTGRVSVNAAVLDLQPDWGIQQVVPHRDSAPWTTLEPGVPLLIELTAHLPSGMVRGTDVLKAFAATAPFDLGDLEVPPLQGSARPARRIGGRGSEPIVGPFGLLAGLGAVVRTAPVRSWDDPADDWTTAELEIHVEARPKGSE